MSTSQQRLQRAGDLFQLLTRLPGSEFGASPECAETDPEAFMPDQDAGPLQIRQAKAVCEQCPIKAACLEFALRNNEPGIWGGRTANERRRLRAGGDPVDLGEAA